MDEALIEALGTSQRLGFLGDWAIPDVIAHARRFVHAIQVHAADEGTPRRVADIGSGGGVPGLVVAHDLPDAEVVLIDRREARTDHLGRLVRRFGWAPRVTVLHLDLDAPPVELVDRFDVVTARGFGPPAATLRAGVALLSTGGLAIVSEPPLPDPARWPDHELNQRDVERLAHDDPAIAVFRRR